MSNLRRPPRPAFEPFVYREACPQLNILEARAAFDRGDTICDFTDRWDAPLGVARFDVSGDRCQLEYEFRFPHIETVSHWEEFQFASVRNGVVDIRSVILCPDCKTKRKILFFKDRWSCASCLSLPFRSQLIHPLARAWEKFDALDRKLKNGKPHALHNKTYVKLLERLELLHGRVYDTDRRHASDKYSDCIKVDWRAPNVRDEAIFLGLKEYAAFLEQQKARAEPLARRLVSPLPFGGEAKREFRGGYEASESEDL